MQIQISGKSIYFESFGKGKPILFVHGWGGTSESLKKLAQLLSKSYQSVIIDLPGFGKSDNPDPSWGIEKYADVLLEFIKKQNLATVIFFGHSFGGTLGLHLTATHPEVVEKLILCAPSYKREGKRSPFSTIGRFLPNSLKQPLYRLFFPKSELFKYPHLEPNFRNLISHDLSQEASQIKTKTLIIWGDKDSYVPVSNAYSLQKLIPDSRLEVVEGIGHGLPLYNPDLVYKKLQNFL